MERTAEVATLARSNSLRLGDLLIDPASRELAGPEGRVTVEPRIMRLLLLLHDNNEKVVTREAIAERCWVGRFVADDTINNAVAELRRALKASAGSSLKVETIPKTGYRLVGGKARQPGGEAVLHTQESTHPRSAMSRRTVMAGGVAAAAVGLASWRFRSSADNQVPILIEEGTQALRMGLPDSGRKAAIALQQAVQRDPGNARALGLLSIAHRASAEYAPPQSRAEELAQAEMTARKALSLDPRQSDALTTLATLTPAFGQWPEAESSLKRVLAIDSGNPFAIAALATLLMSTGQVRACLRRLEDLHRTSPPSPNLQFRRVYTLWSAGHAKEMDRVADAAMQSWPNHGGIWFARLWTLAFTNRAGNALVMVDDPSARPAMPAQGLAVLRASLAALEDPIGPKVKQAIAANVAAAPQGPSQSIAAIMVLSALGAAPAALDVAMSFLARQGSLVIKDRHSPAQPSLPDQHHRMAMMLWVPATRRLRQLPEFRSLCDSIGLLRYWRMTGTRPDEDGIAVLT